MTLPAVPADLELLADVQEKIVRRELEAIDERIPEHERKLIADVRLPILREAAGKLADRLRAAGLL